MISGSSNILSDYSSYTYNFKLYIVSREDYTSLMVNKTPYDQIHNYGFKKQAIVAQSGVTNLKIDDVSITSRPSYTEGVFINNVNFKVTQAKGFSFIESIVTAGAICDWENLFASPFMIFEISFNGWKIGSDGKEYVNPNIQTFSIPIHISSVNTELDGGGSRCSISAVPNFNIDRQSFKTSIGALTVDGCITFQEFTNKFSDALNTEIQKDKTSGEDHKTLHYFNVVDDELKSMILSHPTDQTAPLYNKRTEGGGSGGAFTIPNQMSIPKVIEHVLVACEKMQKMMKMDDMSNIDAKTFQIDPEIKVKNYNQELGEYAYDITWNIRLVPTYKVKNIESSAEGAVFNYITNPENMNFSKVYKHYFTGENSEVLSANLDTKKLFFNKIARYQNLFINENNNPGTVQKEAVATEERQSQVKALPEQMIELEAAARQKAINAAKERYARGVFYVDDISTATVDKLAQVRLYYRITRDTQGSTTQETNGSAGNLRTKDMYNYLRNVRNQLELSAMSLDLEIRGDPFWLKPFNGNYDTHYSNNQFSSSVKHNVIAFITGFPNEVQERGVRNDYTFTGIYIIKSVTSSFTAGKFSQKLECARLPDIRGETIIKNR